MYGLFKQLAFRCDPEWVHEKTLTWMARLHREGKPHFLVGPVEDDPVEVMGLRFPNRVGLAAGMDKNGVAIDAFGSLGFGFVELGTVTPRPQPGNPKPRLFRLPEHEAIINRMGFNNLGVDAMVQAVSRARFDGIIGVNIGKNFDTPIDKATDDYVACLRKAYPVADYIAVNISSPNTSNLRELQKGDAFSGLLRALAETRNQLAEEKGKRVPIAVKIAPDLDAEQIHFMADMLVDAEMDAVIATNTTISRDAIKEHKHVDEAGGLSGAPVRERSTDVIHSLSERLNGAMPIIGVGGIFEVEHAREKIDAGASLVQVYTGLIYKGPVLPKTLINGLRENGTDGDAE